MSKNLMAALRPKRILAEVLARLDYRYFQKIYWALRSDDLIARYSHDSDYEVVTRLLKKANAARVWDIGCGDGRLFPAYVRAEVQDVYALELSDSLIRRAKSRAEGLQTKSKARFHVSRVDLRGDFSFPEKVDVLVSSRVLQHIHPDDLRAVFKKLLRQAPRYVYLNETLGSNDMRHVFSHDYAVILKEYGFEEIDRGTVAPINYEYLVFERKP